MANISFNIAGTAESAEQWDEAEQYYRRSIEVAAKAFPDTNENIEMFRASYAFMLNKQKRFAEAMPLFKTVFSRVERNPQFKDDDVFKASTFGITIAAYGLEPSKQHLAEYEKAVALPADAGPDLEELLAQQSGVISSLGLPVPRKAAGAAAPAKD